MQYCAFNTRDGVFVAGFTETGLAHLRFPQEPSVGETVESPTRDVNTPWYDLTKKAVEQSLRGLSPVTIPPLDLSRGTAFQKDVWNVLLTIRPSATMTYSEVAAAIGRPKAARTVGRACGANPIPLLIPCHRVLAANGRLGGFSAGLRWKLMLLNREGIPLNRF